LPAANNRDDAIAARHSVYVAEEDKPAGTVQSAAARHTADPVDTRHSVGPLPIRAPDRDLVEGKHPAGSRYPVAHVQ
jgi:hypothetical protein